MHEIADYIDSGSRVGLEYRVMASMVGYNEYSRIIGLGLMAFVIGGPKDTPTSLSLPDTETGWYHFFFFFLIQTLQVYTWWSVI